MADRFAFGENWSRYATVIDEQRLQAAVDSLSRLLPELVDWEQSEKSAPTFLDIGCGSGIHSVAAAMLGARVTAFDFDPESVRTTGQLVKRLGLESEISVQQGSILDWPGNETYDFVYSWGVLHHTGRMWDALGRSCELLAPGTDSRLAIALYRRTKACGFWVVEKRWYSNAGPVGQRVARGIFGAGLDLARWRSGTAPWTYRRQYYRQRGMSVSHDLHDWLGGFPYESATPAEVRTFASSRGLAEIRSFVHREDGLESGLFGSGCDEFVFHPAGGFEGDPEAD